MDHSSELGRTSHPWTGFLICALVLPLLYAYAAVPPADATRATSIATVSAPSRYAASAVVGPQQCSECHEREMNVWKDSAHEKDSATLTRSAEANSIAKALGVRCMKTDARCASCHFTLQEHPEKKRPRSVAGVSCESCHGSGQAWLELHADFGPGKQDASEEDPAHRVSRLEACDEAGMLRPAHLFDMAASCHRCHTITDTELIEVGGHPAGDAFEFVAWSQGQVRHNFVRGEDNPMVARERQRVMYVTGRLAALVTAMRADASDAIERERAALEAVVAVHADEHLQAILDLAGSAQPSAVAEEAAERARAFQAAAKGQELSAIDAMLPGPEDYR